MLFIYIWNLTSLILQAGDIELNPQPCPIDPNLGMSYALRRLIEDPTWRQQHLITMTTVMLNVTYDVTVLLQHRVAMQEA